ncbi:MAG: Carbohydrate kinase, FGGY family [uncultured Thermomicrobiales bacterium]|uniref:Carbohydrate kinase, FGGY family n=1 Tax=uncultured Thermomicrobiales bacterium TaxID=1645740 RepID=A0A6J4UA31_9BACT|nr:MAG: Carbohydrate kinase, FGGY family [uncultured Thermomicrobiales bacterium]
MGGADGSHGAGGAGGASARRGRGDLLLGVDIGTYSSKGVLCTPAGEVLADATVEHGLSLPRHGWAEHDADAVWWHDLVAVTRQLLGGRYDGADVGAVAVSAIGSCLLPVDAAGRPLRPGILYGIDTRATDEIAWLNRECGEEALFALGGMALTSQAIGPKILWLRRHEPEVWARTATVMTASSYLVLRLTGETVMDRHSASYYNPLVDLARLEWDDRFAGPIVEPEKLPRLAWSTDVVGAVTAEAAAATGLAPGTPVTAGTVDAAAEAVSVGVVEPGDLMVMYGTTLFFILVTDRPIPDPRLWATGFCLPGRYDVAGGMSTTGALTRWFRDQLGGAEVAAEAAGGPNAYAALADLAAGVPPGAEGLVCLPYFAGERTPINDPEARGVFAGLTLNHTRAHLYRAVLEGTAYGVRHNLETMREIGAVPRRLVAVGGGAKSRLWLQTVTDVAGVAQAVPERTSGAAYGDAFLAGLATGLVPDLAALNRDWVRIGETLAPDPAAHAAYGDYYRVYRDLYAASRDQLHALARLGRGGPAPGGRTPSDDAGVG